MHAHAPQYGCFKVVAGVFIISIHVHVCNIIHVLPLLKYKLLITHDFLIQTIKLLYTFKSIQESDVEKKSIGVIFL
jgi:hypothetical protein